MKIVIDIPEEMWERVKDGYVPLGIGKYLKNGTPLPKGHGRLIDADALGVQISMIRDKYNYYGNEYETACFGSFDRAVDEVIESPTIIEADKDGEQE